MCKWGCILQASIHAQGAYCVTCAYSGLAPHLQATDPQASSSDGSFTSEHSESQADQGTAAEKGMEEAVQSTAPVSEGTVSHSTQPDSLIITSQVGVAGSRCALRRC